MNNLSNNLPGLAIIRTICAFSILLGHFYQFGDWGDLELAPVALPQIYLPVVTFFVITGFLMTWSFLHEEQATGDISVSTSYKRRAKRILPLYYIGIVVGLLALWFCGDRVTHFLSKISYGIYIFHPIMIYVCAEGLKLLPLQLGLGVSVAIVVLVTIGIAILMHHLCTRVTKITRSAQG